MFKYNKEAGEKLAHRLMEEKALQMLIDKYEISIKEAMKKLYSTQTYKWFSAPNDEFGVAREGGVAVGMRVIHELETGELI